MGDVNDKEKRRSFLSKISVRRRASTATVEKVSKETPISPPPQIIRKQNSIEIAAYKIVSTVTFSN
jgi:hypothetical protein